MTKLSIAREAAEKAFAVEEETAKQLLARAEKLLAGIIIVTGFQLLDVTYLLGSSSQWVKALCCAALAALSLASFFGFCSLRLSGYSGYPRGDKLWENLKSETVSDETAEMAVIQLLLKNREQNAKLNDAKIRSLFWCRWLFFGGLSLVTASQLFGVIASMQA